MQPDDPDPRLTAAEDLIREILEALCRRDGLPLESAVVPGEPARNYELAGRLRIGHVFGLMTGQPAMKGNPRMSEDLTAAQGAAIEEDLGRYLTHPMPSGLNEQIKDRIEPHTINSELKHVDVMSCIHVAWLVISDWLRDHPGDLAPPAG